MFLIIFISLYKIILIDKTTARIITRIKKVIISETPFSELLKIDNWKFIEN